MLRISVTTGSHGTVVRLEGRLAGVWVDEFRNCWQRLVPSGGHEILVDLDGVSFVDDAGVVLLRSMRANGALLTASTVMMRALVDEVGATRDRGIE